ncbi:hypothetical protein RRG08_042433 [Elysia crispata]|uniref:Uncharacterized protein n=1 Tax=Elysia crispata TaxID=231223 RepID=A0AAE0ZCA7_9GAST|nr:hypothetical protein RRG08_042433 [Elysia crispata]
MSEGASSSTTRRPQSKHEELRLVLRWGTSAPRAATVDIRHMALGNQTHSLLELKPFPSPAKPFPLLQLKPSSSSSQTLPSPPAKPFPLLRLNPSPSSTQTLPPSPAKTFPLLQPNPSPSSSETHPPPPAKPSPSSS